MEEVVNLENIYFFDTLDSTNLYAQELIKSKKIINNSLIVAKSQTAGKGQMGAKWVSNYGENLLFSLALFPGYLPIDDVFYLSKITSLALCDFVNGLTEGQVSIKWPNDILIGRRKVGGILIENNIFGNRVGSTVIGIGLNINQESFDGELNATSIVQESGKKHELTELPAKFLSYFSKWYYISEKQRIDSEYLNRLYAFGKTKSFMDRDGIFKAEIVGIEKSGLLQLRKEDGNLCVYEIKEVRFIM